MVDDSATKDQTLNLSRFLQIVEDFGNMSTGKFVEKYPDCGPFEGYLYVQRKARLIAKAEGRSNGR